MRAFTKRRSLPFGWLLLGLATAGCTTTRNQDPEYTELRGAPDRLQELQPADIALAPLRNQTENDSVPLELVREAFYEGLVERLYSPLDLDYVDGHWLESSFGGSPAPDALLVVAITGWDSSQMFSTGRVDIAAELLLFPGASTTETPIWGLSMRRLVDLSVGGRPPGPRDDLLPSAIRIFAREALAQLPERDPEFAHR